MNDLISRQVAIDAITDELMPSTPLSAVIRAKNRLKGLPSAQPEYEPVTAEDFAKTMSETSVYRYMVWHSEALTLMKRQGFVICKKTM